MNVNKCEKESINIINTADAVGKNGALHSSDLWHGTQSKPIICIYLCLLVCALCSGVHKKMDTIYLCII